MNVIKVIEFEQRIISKYYDQHFILYILYCFSKCTKIHRLLMIHIFAVVLRELWFDLGLWKRILINFFWMLIGFKVYLLFFFLIEISSFCLLTKVDCANYFELKRSFKFQTLGEWSLTKVWKDTSERFPSSKIDHCGC